MFLGGTARSVSVLSSRVVWVRREGDFARNLRPHHVSVLSSRVVWVRPCEVEVTGLLPKRFSSLKSSRLGETCAKYRLLRPAYTVSVLSSRVVWVRPYSDTTRKITLAGFQFSQVESFG